jgi:hypothetical protein
MEQSDYINIDDLLWHVEVLGKDEKSRQRGRKVRRMLKTSEAWSAYLRAFGPGGGGIVSVDIGGQTGLLEYTPTGF